MVPVRIEREDFAWQQTVGLVLPVQDWKMRNNTTLREPAQKGAGAIGFIRCQLLGLQSMSSAHSLQHGSGRGVLLRQTCRRGLNVDDDRMFGVNKIVEVAELASSLLHVYTAAGSVGERYRASPG